MFDIEHKCLFCHYVENTYAMCFVSYHIQLYLCQLLFMWCRNTALSYFHFIYIIWRGDDVKNNILLLNTIVIDIENVDIVSMLFCSWIIICGVRSKQYFFLFLWCVCGWEGGWCICMIKKQFIVLTYVHVSSLIQCIYVGKRWWIENIMLVLIYTYVFECNYIIICGTECIFFVTIKQ